MREESPCNKYDAEVIHASLKEELANDKVKVLLALMSMIVLTCFVLPLAVLGMLSMVAYTHLPLVNHHFSFNHEFFLIPFSIILGFYFLSIYQQIDKTYGKALTLFAMTVVISCLSLVFKEYRLFFGIVYAVFFVMTLYALSMAYLSHKEQHTLLDERVCNDYGTYGMMDNPLSLQDDKNRATLAIATASTGFFAIAMFTTFFWKSLIYYRAIGERKYLIGAVRFLDALFESGMSIDHAKPNAYVQAILENRGYLNFLENGYSILEKSRVLALKAKIQRQ